MIVMTGLLIRLAWGVHLPTDESSLAALPDQIEYLHIGQNVLNGEGFAFFDPRFQDTVRAYRMPGYPLLIAACDGKVMLVRIVQALLDASTILATYFLARRWLSESGSLAAAGLVALNPFLIYFSGLLLSETPFTAMLMWGVTLLAAGGGPLRRQIPPLVAWLIGEIMIAPATLVGGFLIALSILVRPSAVGLPLLIGISGAFIGPAVGRSRIAEKLTRPIRWPLPIATTFILMTVLVLIPWTVRNYSTLKSIGGPTFLWDTTNAGITKYDGFNPSATGQSDQRFVQSIAPRLRTLSEVDRSLYFSDLADESIRQTSVMDLASLTIRKVARTWSPIPLSELAASHRATIAAGLLYAVPVSILVLAGLFGKGIALSGKLFLLLTPAYLTFLVAMSVGSLRYRVPAEPMMAILAASAVSNWMDHRGFGRLGWRRSEKAPQDAAV
jgi:hypothetical protein